MSKPGGHVAAEGSERFALPPPLDRDDAVVGLPWIDVGRVGERVRLRGVHEEHVRGVERGLELAVAHATPRIEAPRRSGLAGGGRKRGRGPRLLAGEVVEVVGRRQSRRGLGRGERLVSAVVRQHQQLAAAVDDRVLHRGRLVRVDEDLSGVDAGAREFAERQRARLVAADAPVDDRLAAESHEPDCDVRGAAAAGLFE